VVILFEKSILFFIETGVFPQNIAAPVKKGTKKHGKVHRQGKRKEARYP
jgi:hypothetical protein